MSINLPLPLLGEMAIFVKVVETGSFSGAARQLSVSPSAVSRSISRLEKALATRLLQRTTRKLRLSEGGEEVFKRCQEMVNAARSVMEISGQFTHEAEGLVRVSVPKAVGRFVVHPHMPEFLRRYPKVDVQLILEDRQVDMIDDNVDLSIRITDSRRRGWWGGSYCRSSICCVRRRSIWPNTVCRSIPTICWNTAASTLAKPRATRVGNSDRTVRL